MATSRRTNNSRTGSVFSVSTSPIPISRILVLVLRVLLLLFLSMLPLLLYRHIALGACSPLLPPPPVAFRRSTTVWVVTCLVPPFACLARHRTRH